ncbi:uncharacterized protein C18orf19 homolog A [Topomyia yanbarensis]|uniref:uncharacterized protein C18orf19 homolog A n=1 Tax=Topomyia yanbarensis TaxID=2498891 RepID=UPI00273B60EE|nr:uncharacterized protein C18orf19 homolog A [Topomyia yanbarensis]
MSLLNLSRLAMAGMAARSSTNRFTVRLQNNAAQLRNLAFCSNRSIPCWTDEQRQYNTVGHRHFPVLFRQSFQLRQFHGNGLRQKQQEQTPDSSRKDESPEATPLEEPAKLGLVARFRKMYKEYWYVLVPVHCITSVFWFGGFYYASTSGVDVISLLESIGVSEKLIDPVRDSSLGHIAVAYLLYKIATPARYTVTLGGTTISIKYLVQLGYIKPIPSKAKLVQMYKDKKENLQERIAEKKQDFQERKQQLEERKKNLMDDLEQYKSGVKSIKDKKQGVTDEK